MKCVDFEIQRFHLQLQNFYPQCYFREEGGDYCALLAFLNSPQLKVISPKCYDPHKFSNFFNSGICALNRLKSGLPLCHREQGINWALILLSYCKKSTSTNCIFNFIKNLSPGLKKLSPECFESKDSLVDAGICSLSHIKKYSPYPQRVDCYYCDRKCKRFEKYCKNNLLILDNRVSQTFKITAEFFTSKNSREKTFKSFKCIKNIENYTFLINSMKEVNLSENECKKKWKTELQEYIKYSICSEALSRKPSVGKVFMAAVCVVSDLYELSEIYDTRLTSKNTLDFYADEERIVFGTPEIFNNLGARISMPRNWLHKSIPEGNFAYDNHKNNIIMRWECFERDGETFIIFKNHTKTREKTQLQRVFTRLKKNKNCEDVNQKFKNEYEDYYINSFHHSWDIWPGQYLLQLEEFFFY